MSTDSPYNDNGGHPRRYDIDPWRKWAYYGGVAQGPGRCGHHPVSSG
ncbi:hypothetical protein ABXS69_00430 [Actinomyces timonensis]|uniref:Uncharacterized protein n=1 Tax=Actinomyces timonensis TaxID=1288391 RepID=A0AAU8N603_9ACTO